MKDKYRTKDLQIFLGKTHISPNRDQEKAFMVIRTTHCIMLWSKPLSCEFKSQNFKFIIFHKTSHRNTRHHDKILTNTKKACQSVYLFSNCMGRRNQSSSLQNTNKDFQICLTPTQVTNHSGIQVLRFSSATIPVKVELNIRNNPNLKLRKTIEVT